MKTSLYTVLRNIKFKHSRYLFGNASITYLFVMITEFGIKQPEFRRIASRIINNVNYSQDKLIYLAKNNL